MKPSILLLGPSGQIGRELRQLLPQIGDIVALDRRALDLAQPSAIRSAIHAHRPGLIVNAAAYTNVDQAESDASSARAINATAPAILAEEAAKIGALLVHFSTDYVFDGSKSTPYEESDPPNPLNVYGRTKLEGELAIAEAHIPHLIFRTSWVYASEGKNFLVRILQLAAARDELRIVNDQIGVPTSSIEIANATAQIVASLYENQANRALLESVSGTYHMTAAGRTTWHEFAQAIIEEARNAAPRPAWLSAATGNLPLKVQSLVPISTAEFPTPAKRPAYSVLSNARLERTFGVHLPEWRLQLHRLFAVGFSSQA